MNNLLKSVEQLKPGSYVLAVSGGVDSMVLAHVLHGQSGLDLIVAHYDHGMRPDAHKDRQLVEQWATAHDIRFEYAEGSLGAGTSEAVARDARYGFLRSIQAQYKCAAIVTAHHQDDIVETQIMQLLRGNGRSALSAMQSTDSIVRPFLGVTKEEIIAYAKKRAIPWREDATNTDTTYTRNYVRAHIVPSLTQEARSQLLSLHATSGTHNKIIDELLAEEIARTTTIKDGKVRFSRSTFVHYEKPVALEYLRSLLLMVAPTIELSTQRLLALWLFCKTAQSHKKRSFGMVELQIIDGSIELSSTRS